MRLNDTSAYQEMMINSKMLEVPRGTYPEHPPGPQDRSSIRHSVT